MTKITYIPGEIANAAIDEHGNRKPVTRTHHIFDDTLEKPQSEVNQERIEDVATLDGKIALEKQRAEGVESGLNNRLGTVEQLAEISIGGGDAQIATGADFTNPDATKRAKVPTVGAIVDGLNDGIYDVSKRNPTGGPNSDGKFTLDYILDNASTLIPTGWRHGGMTISFVHTSDNMYMQYRLMADEFSTTVSDWQGVDDVPTPSSNNLVKSSGIFENEYKTAPIYDISLHNLTDGNPTHYSDFANAVTVANIPSSYRRGGMMVRFILQSGAEPATTDKYVQYRFKLYHFGSTAFTNPDNWETVTDIVKQGSDDLPTSNAVYNAIIDKIGKLVANGTAITSTSSTSYLINSSIIPEIPAGTTLKIKFSGIGINVSQYRITLNESIVDTDSELYSIVLSEPLTTLKVAVRSSKVLINGATVSAQVYIKGLVYEQAEQAEKIVNLQNRVLSLESDGSLMSAIEVYKVPNTQNQYSSFDLAFAPNAFPIIKRLCSMAKYIQNNTTEVPTVCFSYSNGVQTYNTIKSTLGYNGEFGKREMRIPVFPPETKTLVMKVNVPTGITLYIDDFRICENITDKPNDVRINSHGVGAPFNTLLGFIHSAKLGCGCCIAVPKRTSDGVWCCYHDDANINTLRYENGQKVCSLVDGTYIRYDASGNQIGTGAMPISSINWTDLRTFIIFQYFWKNQRVPSIGEFFAVCMKTGMHPMFSIHPAYTSSEIQELYALAKQYHIIDKLNLKASVNDTIIEDFYAVFGDEVESYTFDASNTTKINTSITRLNALQTNAKKIIEISDTNEVTQSNINLILNAGFKAAAYIDTIESTEYVENLLKMGISEIATGSMMSFGLNW